MTVAMTLADLCSDIVDCAHKTAPIDESGEHFAVGTPAMRNHIINFSEARRISEATFKAWTTRLRPRVGDLLLAREAPVGPVVRIPESENVAPGQRTVLLRPRAGTCDSRFLYYFLTSPRVQAELQVKAAGSTVPHLNVADVRTLPADAVPPLAEQRAIAEVLGALDDKIAANARSADIVDELLATRFARLSAGRARVGLGTIASVNQRSTKPQAGGTLRYLDISSVGRGVYDLPAESSWDDAPGRARRLVAQGDVVWSTVRPNRRSHALVLDDDDKLIGSTGLAVLTPAPGRTAGLYEATRTDGFVAYLETVAEGSAYPAVRAERFLEAPVPELDPKEWDQFEVLALPLREHVHASKVESRRLAAARDELLPLLMSGKARVKDAEKTVEGVL
ncbi:MAG: restriction endonuclease subunit S [Actinobacteria bacterium]|nr:restriction endonuclease subunit S [Actinomycetota bacterium]